MQDIVGQMNLKCTLWTDALDVFLRLIKRQMHRMRVVTEGIDDEGIDADEGAHNVCANRAGIRDVGQVADAIPEDIERAVGDGQNSNGHPSERQLLPGGEFVQGQIGS